jgi:hypothetical protein
MPVQISTTRAESVYDEGRKYRSDVLAYDNVGNFIEFGRFAFAIPSQALGSADRLARDHDQQGNSRSPHKFRADNARRRAGGALN